MTHQGEWNLGWIIGGVGFIALAIVYYINRQLAEWQLRREANERNQRRLGRDE